MPLPVLDLFAGPGGLGEGFAQPTRRVSKGSPRVSKGSPPFRVALSIEKDPVARETLRLRAFFRQFDAGSAPEQYYDSLRGETTLKELYDFFPEQSAAAAREAWRAELGQTPAEEIDHRITTALAGEQPWILIGGPPPARPTPSSAAPASAASTPTTTASTSTANTSASSPSTARRCS